MKYDIVLDSEADNLHPYCTKVHCVVVKAINLIGANRREFYERDALLKALPHLNKVIAHGGLSYDLELFSRVWDIPYKVSADGKGDTWGGCPVEFIDTLQLSQFLNPDRLGGHSVEAWSERLTGAPKKVQNEVWDTFTPLMLERCRSDTTITALIYEALLKEVEERL